MFNINGHFSLAQLGKLLNCIYFMNHLVYSTHVKQWLKIMTSEIFLKKPHYMDSGTWCSGTDRLQKGNYKS